MSIDATSATSSTATSAASQLNMQDLLKIMLTQLTNQDPLKPMDNTAFVGQLAQFSMLELSQETNDKLDSLVSTQASLQSVGLIGRTVDVQTDSGTITGTVASLSFSGSSPTLTLTTTGGQTLSGLSLSAITAVR